MTSGFDLIPDEATLEHYIWRFEDAWKEGTRPVIDKYLPDDGEKRRDALIELVQIDLELRLKAGEPARVEEYLNRYPELGRSSELILGLLQAEMEKRCRREPTLDPTDFVRRFPRHQE